MSKRIPKNSTKTDDYPRVNIENTDYIFRSIPKNDKLYKFYSNLHDSYLPPLSKFQRPYFSPKRNSW
jgi:hypothetical protein